MSGATALAEGTLGGFGAIEAGFDWWDAFLGFVPGSMGETSALACLAGAALLILSGVGSWRTMVSVAVGTFVMATVLNVIGSSTNPFFDVPPVWHFVLGGWAFGTVFMATDPVSAPSSARGSLCLRFS